LKTNEQLLLTKAAFNEWWRCVNAFEYVLISIIEELEENRKGVNIATITGSSFGLIGAVLSAIGILGAPATAGLSLSLTVGGAVIASTGAITSVGAKLTEMVLSKKKEKSLARYKIKMDVLSNLLQHKMKKLQQKMYGIGGARNGEAFQGAPQWIRGLWGVGSVPLIILRVLSRAVVEAEAVFLPVAIFMDTVLAIVAAKNLYEGSVTSKSLCLRNQRNRLRLVRQQMLAYMYGNSEEFEVQ
jgi:hypothetical protein